MSELITKRKLVDDVFVLLHDADVLLMETAGNLGEKASDARARIEQGFRSARERIGQIHEQGIEGVKASAKAADRFVSDHPWSCVGIAAMVGALAGLLIARRN